MLQIVISPITAEWFPYDHSDPWTCFAVIISHHNDHNDHMETSLYSTQLSQIQCQKFHLQCSSTVFRPLFQLWQSIDKKNTFTLGWNINTEKSTCMLLWAKKKI